MTRCGFPARIGGVPESLTADGQDGASLGTPYESISLTDDAGFEDDWTLTLTSESLTLVGDTLTESASGTERQDAFEGEDLVCGFTRTLTATRDPAP